MAPPAAHSPHAPPLPPAPIPAPTPQQQQYAFFPPPAHLSPAEAQANGGPGSRPAQHAAAAPELQAMAVGGRPAGGPPAWMLLNIIPLPGQFIPHLHAPVPKPQAAAASTRQSAPEEEDGDLCVVCMENHRNIVLLPCAHIVLCSLCFRGIQGQANVRPACPMCRDVVTSHMLLD